MKPLGVRFGIDANGLPTVGVTRPSEVEDAVWKAVELAMENGWTPERFRREVAWAWAEKIDDNAKQAIKEASEAFRA
jgi:hypothetical protein